MSKKKLGIVALLATLALVLPLSVAAHADTTLTIPLNNNTADIGTDCPATGTYWHFVISPNNGHSAFITFHLNLGDPTTYNTTIFVPNGTQFDNVFVAVPAGKTLLSLITTGSTAEITWDGTGSQPTKFQLSHTCPGAQAKPPTVSKDAAGTYDDTFTWTITKAVDTNNVLSAGGGESGAANYTVTVSHGDSAVSNVKVTGTITVSNPNTADITLATISDTLDGTTCTVDVSGGPIVPPTGATFPYECDLGDSLPSGDVTNTVTTTWLEQTLSDNSHLAAGSADFTTDPVAFTANEIDECTTVDDTNPNGPQDVVVCAATDPNPKTFTYSDTFTDPAGTCTDHDNTASFITNDLGKTGSASQTVTDCQGADLTVSKDATPSFERKYKWNISKSVDKTHVDIPTDSGTATFTYTIQVGHDAGKDSGWAVNGTITITNPNDWEDITLTDLGDAVDNGGACTVDAPGPGGYVVPKSGHIDVNYSCTYAAAPSPTDGTNTATATWDAATYSTPTGSAEGTKDFAFTDPTTVTDECVSVDDSFAGHLGDVCVGDANPTTFTYSRTVNAPPIGTCVDYKNTATFTTNDTGTTGEASQTVTVCRFNAPLTPGYWKNHLTFDNKHPDAPYAAKFLPQTIGNYSVGTTSQVTSIFNAMNCSNASSSSQNAIGCLAGHLLATKLNLANTSNTCILPVVQKADSWLKGNTEDGVPGKVYTGPSSSYTLTQAQRNEAIALKNPLDTYNNGGGC